MIHAASKFNGALPICRYLCADSNVRGIADSCSQLGMKSARFGPYFVPPTLTISSHKGQCKSFGRFHCLVLTLRPQPASLFPDVLHSCIHCAFMRSKSVSKRLHFLIEPRPLLNLLSMASQKLAANVLRRARCFRQPNLFPPVRQLNTVSAFFFVYRSFSRSAISSSILAASRIPIRKISHGMPCH